jgi:thiol-disulfide isomerase/thioredoxin
VKRLILIAAAVVAVAAAGFGARFALTAFKPETWSSSEVAEDRDVVAAMFFSNFCGACKILDPRIAEVRPEYLDRPVDFVKFNQTFSAFNTRELEALADAHGIRRVFETHQGKTGFMVLVDPASQRELEVVTVAYQPDDIRDALDRALAGQAGS